MNREITFRVWDKEREEMWTPGDWPDYDRSYNLVELCCEPPKLLSGAIRQLQGDRWVVQQYTGLDDCEGTPIYEGDVVGFGGKTCSVGWSQFEGGWILRAITGQVVRMNKPTAKQGDKIGNRFENPELVEGEDGKN